MTFVAYYRVSTAKQGNSGLGLKAQGASVQAYAKDGLIAAEYVDVESGKRNDRPKPAQAIERARREGATLIIAKRMWLAVGRRTVNVHLSSAIFQFSVDSSCHHHQQRIITSPEGESPVIGTGNVPIT